MYSQSFSPAQQVDFALFLVFAFAGVVLLILTVTTLLFIIRYRHEKHPEAADIRGNTKLEILWTVIPSILVLGLFYFGWTGYQALRTVPSDAMPVQVTAKMFSWTFTYENGRHSNILVVPTGKPILLKMHTTDVIHSFFAPAFRIKMDVVPGMETYTWFKAEKDGEYEIFCTEYCGTGHSAMLSTIKAVPTAEFDEWLEAKEALIGPEAGHALMNAQGCYGCHVMSGSTGIAPSLSGLYGAKVDVTIDGKKQTVTADDAYIKESIVEPGKMIVDGYDNTMPPYTDLKDSEIDAILAYLRIIGKDSPTGVRSEGLPTESEQSAPAGNGTNHGGQHEHPKP